MSSVRTAAEIIRYARFRASGGSVSAPWVAHWRREWQRLRSTVLHITWIPARLAAVLGAYGDQSTLNSYDQSIADPLGAGGSDTTTVYPQDPGHQYNCRSKASATGT